MKAIYLLVLVCIFSLSAQARVTCEDQEHQARNLLNIIRVYNVDVATAEKKVKEARQQLAYGFFCKPRINFNPLMLCVSLTPAHAYFGLKTENPANQYELDKALIDYGRMFPSSRETDGFSCDLKELKYSTAPY